MSAMGFGLAVSVTGVVASTVVAYRAVASGQLTLDVGIGRRTAPLGPVTVDIAAPRDLVFEVVAAPYLGRGGAAAAHIDVLERGSDLVVAAHRTAVGNGLVTTTVESVGFDPPARVTFRLLRGPVPHVTEVFLLEEVGPGTRLRYEGEIGTDFWAAGAAWGSVVARSWERTVKASLDDIRERSEQRAAARHRRATSG
jgi:hypothetical protein